MEMSLLADLLGDDREDGRGAFRLDCEALVAGTDALLIFFDESSLDGVLLILLDLLGVEIISCSYSLPSSDSSLSSSKTKGTGISPLGSLVGVRVLF